VPTPILSHFCSLCCADTGYGTERMDSHGFWPDRALTSASDMCALKLRKLQAINPNAKYCTSCGGDSNGKSVWLIGKPVFGQDHHLPSVGRPSGSIEFDCSYLHHYGCCIDS
jgi:hypothetical protein